MQLAESRARAICLAGLALTLPGCLLTTPLDTGDSAIATASVSDAGTKQGATRQTALSGSLTGALNYRVISLGPAEAGQRWTVRPSGILTAAFVVAFFDQDQNLLKRTFLSTGVTHEHVLRESTSDLRIGLMVPSGRAGGNYNLAIEMTPDQPIPAPTRQVVWLNFAASSSVQIHTRSAVSFPAFDAARINAEYSGQTAEMRDAIVATVTQDYADYDVQILRSDQDPRPTGPHSVVHFGGTSTGLLGLADSVDGYNSDPSQEAIIYVESFAPYRTMRLTAAEMGVMIGNVASHELGHLLGLFHTSAPDDVMDTTGSAWDLAGAQQFSRAPLEETVFATGMEDGPKLLSQIVGPGTGPKTAGLLKVAPRIQAEIEALAHLEIPYTCGTCCGVVDGDG